jgi:hypothetical protein
VFLAVLVLLDCALPILSRGADSPSAGSIKALIPDATDNASPLTVNEPLHWNDLLQTDAKGRVRAGLNDGSILSIGSNSQLKIVQHDAATQQTNVELNYGKLRNQVTKITQPQGKYQVKTANAVIGVIGTDFYVDYKKGRTTIICYEGRVSVMPLNGAKVLGSTDAPVAPDGSVTLKAGQIVIIGPPISRDEELLYPVLMQAGKDDTDVTLARTDAKVCPEDEAQMVDMINQTRGVKDVPPVTVDQRLTEAARQHTWTEIDAGALSHQFPGEPDLSGRLEEAKVPFDSAGENLAWDADVVAAHQSLLDDAGHLRNIMDPKFNVVGVGVICSGDHVYATEDFAHIAKPK